MNGKWKALVGLVLVVSCGVFSSAAAAGEKVEKAKTESTFSVAATNGYRVDVTAEHEAGEKLASVTVTAKRARYKDEEEAFNYTVKAPMSRRGGFDARLPGLGRIDVSFAQKSVRKGETPPPSPCWGSPQTDRKGTFRGTISFRGEGGFTVAHASAAKGDVKEYPRRTCKETEGGWFEESTGGPKEASLNIEGAAGNPEVDFYASGYPESEPPTTSGGIPTVTFGARWSGEKRGIGILAVIYRDGVSNYFQVPGPVGVIDDATVTPPAPFEGTGTYHAESPTTSTWTGDLSVRFAGAIGTVPLTGLGSTARLCEGFGTTKCTGPPLPPA